MSLWENIQAIRDKIKEVVEAELGAEVNNVVVGTKARLSQLRPPYLWVLPVESPVDDEGLAINEKWDLSFWLIAVIKDTDSDEGKDLAEQLAIRASGSLLADRSLGDLVNDTKRTGWAPGDARVVEEGELLYGAGVQVKVILTNKEAM